MQIPNNIILRSDDDTTLTYAEGNRGRKLGWSLDFGGNQETGMKMFNFLADNLAVEFALVNFDRSDGANRSFFTTSFSES